MESFAFTYLSLNVIFQFTRLGGIINRIRAKQKGNKLADVTQNVRVILIICFRVFAHLDCFLNQALGHFYSDSLSSTV